MSNKELWINQLYFTDSKMHIFHILMSLKSGCFLRVDAVTRAVSQVAVVMVGIACMCTSTWSKLFISSLYHLVIRIVDITCC